MNIAVINAAKTQLGVALPALVSAAHAYVAAIRGSGWTGPTPTFTTPAKAGPSDWQMIFLDNADVANALGYHDLSPNGMPYSRIFVETAVQNGELPCVTFAHELGEMMIDPMCQQLRMNLATGDIYPLEIADPVEEDTFEIQGIKFSNFVLPSWFTSWGRPTRFDYMGKLTAPFQLDAGGYASVLKAGAFTQIFGSQAKAERFVKEDRRGHRTEQWRRQLAHAKAVK